MTALNIQKITSSFIELVVSVKKNPTLDQMGHAVAKIRAMAANLEEFATQMEAQINAAREYQRHG